MTGRWAVSLVEMPSALMVDQSAPAVLAASVVVAAPSMVPLNMSGVQVALDEVPLAASEPTSMFRKIM